MRVCLFPVANDALCERNSDLGLVVIGRYHIDFLPRNKLAIPLSKYSGTPQVQDLYPPQVKDQLVERIHSKRTDTTDCRTLPANAVSK